MFLKKFRNIFLSWKQMLRVRVKGNIRQRNNVSTTAIVSATMFRRFTAGRALSVHLRCLLQRGCLLPYKTLFKYSQLPLLRTLPGPRVSVPNIVCNNGRLFQSNVYKNYRMGILQLSGFHLLKQKISRRTIKRREAWSR